MPSEPRAKIIGDHELMEYDLACPECGAKMVLRSSKYGPFYGCSTYPRCKSTHGAHKATGAPLGKPATPEVKLARIAAHEAFDRIWKGKLMKRNSAYGWLADQLGMPRPEVHIGNFDGPRCAQVVEVVERFFKSRS